MAFGFARLRFPGRRVLFVLLLSTMMLPDVVTLVPQFILFRSLGWVDTFLPLTVPAFLGGGAFNIFLVRQFYLTIPRDFDEAARIDGASNLRIWWHIMLPLSRPVLIAVGIFSFVYHWNDFLLPLIYLQSEGNKTLALGLRAFISPDRRVVEHQHGGVDVPGDPGADRLLRGAAPVHPGCGDDRDPGQIVHGVQESTKFWRDGGGVQPCQQGESTGRAWPDSGCSRSVCSWRRRSPGCSSRTWAPTW